MATKTARASSMKRSISRVLRVRDNGRGMPTVVDSTGRLGLDVVDALAEKLDGHFTVTTDHGTIADVEFKLEPLREE